MDIEMHNARGIQPKLVRDQIPSLIAKDGKTVVIAKLSDDDFYRALKNKLQEEVQEFIDDQNIEELADVLEVVLAIADARFGGVDELEMARKRKRLAKGAFNERFYIISENSDPITII